MSRDKALASRASWTAKIGGYFDTGSLEKIDSRPLLERVL
jgi:hypothetical protein